MKTQLFFVTAIFTLFLLLSGLASANTLDSPAKEKVESNLLVGVQSSNEGLKISSAFYLGEIKSEKGVNHLMKILREDSNPGARLMAALSLIKIEDPQGLYLVKRTAQFNSEERVRRMSDKLYYAYLINKYVEENPKEAPSFAVLKK
ncbi:MAG: HEAT repeat domain-containing protein [Bacteroidetes bacterium]|nr:HEAT repeat domain-containing protein [Bacteroidota bacterium]